MSQNGANLGGLPIEVFTLVAKLLASSPVPTIASPARNLGPDSGAADAWTDWASERRDILHLSLASREIQNCCKQYLWRNVAFQSSRSLERLLPVFVKNPELGKYVRGMFFLEITATPQHMYYQNDMEKLTEYTPNVEDLLFTDWSILRYPLPLAEALWLDLKKEYLRASDTSDPPPPLHRLKVFRYRQPFRVRLDDEPRERYVFPFMPYHSAITTLEVWMDGMSVWDANKYPAEFMVTGLLDQAAPVILPGLGPSYPTLPHLNIIRLFGTHAQERQVAMAVQACPSLEELMVKFMGDYAVHDGRADNVMSGGTELFEDGQWGEVNQLEGTQHAIGSAPKPGIPISDALEMVSGTLRTLDITGCGCASYLYRQAPGKAKCSPGDFRILSLPRLESLEHLTVDLWGLFGSVAFTTRMDILTLANRIPPSVVTLEVRMKWNPCMEEYVRSNGWEFIHLFDISIVAGGILHLLEGESHHLRQLTFVHPGASKDKPSVRAVFDHTLREFEAEALGKGLESFEAVECDSWKGYSHVNARRHRSRSNRSKFARILDHDVEWPGWEQLLEEMHEKNATHSLVIDRATRLMPLMEGGGAVAVEEE